MFWILSVSIKVVGLQVHATMPSSPEVSLFVLLTISLTETTKDPPVPLLGQLQGMQQLNSARDCPLPSLTAMQLKWLAWSCLSPCFGRQD